MTNRMSLDDDATEGLVGKTEQDLSEGGERTINVKTFDSAIFVVSRKQAVVSPMLLVFFDDTKTKSVDLAKEPYLRGQIFQNVYHWLERKNGTDSPEIPKPLKSKVMTVVCQDEWDAKYADELWARDRLEFYETMKCAHYFCINGLESLLCAKTASVIKGTSISQIKDRLLPKTHAERKKHVSS